MAEPALTAEEWGDLQAGISWEGPLNKRLGYLNLSDGVLTLDSSYDEAETQAVAALCLHGQPFGFAWEDVDEIEEAIGDSYVLCSDRCVGGCDCDKTVARLRSLADRIAALLPPRDNG